MYIIVVLLEDIATIAVSVLNAHSQIFRMIIR